ncbi:MAG: M17 family peptidase N-terminal domain-containing protein, partial [Gemmatimonadota bacterium]
MPLTTSVVAVMPETHQTPLLAIAVARGGMPLSLAALNRATDGALERVFSSTDFTGKRDELAVLYPTGPAKRIVLIGMGKPDDVTRGTVRRAAGVAAKRARVLGAPAASFHVPIESRGTVSGQDVGQAAAEG